MLTDFDTNRCAVSSINCPHSMIKFSYFLFKTVAKGYELLQKANIYVVPFQFVKNSYF